VGIKWKGRVYEKIAPPWLAYLWSIGKKKKETGTVFPPKKKTPLKRRGLEERVFPNSEN